VPDQQPESEAEPIVERVVGAVEGVVKAAVRATSRQLDDVPGSCARRLRKQARDALPYLYETHPEARQAFPRELGTLTIDVADIAGTAVAPAGQRGVDFLPLPPFRSTNWRGRWQRILAANERLAILPPIDVVRYADRYWVTDGHNRVAAALHNGQPQIDANVVDLRPRDGTRPIVNASLAATIEDHDQLKAALSRRTLRTASVRPAVGEVEGPHRPPGDGNDQRP
jgi:hypothetical protein